MADFNGVPIATQSVFFIGSQSATGTKLTRVWATKTQGNDLEDVTPTEFVQGIGQRAQSDLRKVNLTCRFYNDSQIVYNIANNIPIAATGFNNPCDYTEKYVILIIDRAAGSDKCYLLSDTNSVGGRRIPYKKNSAIIITTNFEANERDPSYPVLIRGTSAYLQSVLGVRNPLA